MDIYLNMHGAKVALRVKARQRLKPQLHQVATVELSKALTPICSMAPVLWVVSHSNLSLLYDIRYEKNKEFDCAEYVTNKGLI